jgi:hypothetical protein
VAEREARRGAAQAGVVALAVTQDGREQQAVGAGGGGGGVLDARAVGLVQRDYGRALASQADGLDVVSEVFEVAGQGREGGQGCALPAAGVRSARPSPGRSVG